MREEWKGFKNGAWEKEINVRDFIQKNYEPYDGDASFLAGPTQNTTDLWNHVRAALLRCADQMPKGENKHNEQDCQPEQRKLPTACPLSAAHFRLGQTASDRFLRSYRLHMPRTAMCMGGFPPIAASVMSFLLLSCHVITFL